MIVVVGDRIPPRVRGFLELWLLEPKPGVFVGSLNKSTETYLMKFIAPYLTESTGIGIFRDNKKSIQGFDMNCSGKTNRILKHHDGITLVVRR
jgi:CRISPR-associated protein Cas2